MDQYPLCSRLLLILQSPDELKCFNTVHPQSGWPEDLLGWEWATSAGVSGHMPMHSFTSFQLCHPLDSFFPDSFFLLSVRSCARITEMSRIQPLLIGHSSSITRKTKRDSSSVIGQKYAPRRFGERRRVLLGRGKAMT